MAAETKVGTIHDVGYQPYRGPRTPPARRFWAITRNVWTMALGGRGTRFTLIATAMTFLGAAVFMIVMARTARFGRVDRVVFTATEFFSFWGFLLSLSVACAAVADDLKLGAFQFYFARPIRPRDYVIGKLLGIMAVVGVPMFAGPVSLAILRLLLTDSLSEAASLAIVIPKAIALGLVATAAFALPAAGLGALVRGRTAARAAYAIYYLVVASVVDGLAQASARLSWLKLLVAHADVFTVGRALFDFQPRAHDPPAWAAAAAVAVIALAGFFVVHHRVRSAETAGLGGSG